MRVNLPIDREIACVAFWGFVLGLCFLAGVQVGLNSGKDNAYSQVKSGWVEVEGKVYYCTPQPGVRMVGGKPVKAEPE